MMRREANKDNFRGFDWLNGLRNGGETVRNGYVIFTESKLEPKKSYKRVH